jgi:hypothetical protein
VQVTLETGGGFTGLHLTATAETDDVLPIGEAAAGLEALRALSAAPPPAPSPVPRYRVTVEDPAAGPWTVEVTEPTVPEAARPLLTELLRRARPPG